MKISLENLKLYLLSAMEICQNTMDNVHSKGFDMSHPDYLQAYGAKWAYRNILEKLEDEE